MSLHCLWHIRITIQCIIKVGQTWWWPPDVPLTSVMSPWRRSLEKTVFCDVVLHSFTKVSFVQITNHTVGGEFGQPKPALGESWKRIPDVRLLLTHDPSSNACEVAVIKHSSIVSPPSNFSMFVLFSWFTSYCKMALAFARWFSRPQVPSILRFHWMFGGGHGLQACNKQASFCITKRGLQSAEAEL
jgi:hypothetical protein